jgi:hypothetical protein
VFAVVVRLEARNNDAGLLVLRVDEIILADIDPNVRQATLKRVLEKDEIAGPPFAATDRTAMAPLLLNSTADISAGGFLVDIPGEAGAVESLR